MIQARTLHLQRTLNSLSTEDPQPPINASNIVSLTSRLDELEAHVSATSAAQKNTLLPPPATAATSAKLTTDVRKALQPDLDALNRAVRRYEKRATLLALQTEARLQDLESRMSDAITLAAAAERSISSQTARRTSSTLTLLDWLCSAVVLPVQATWALFSLPAKLAATALDRVVERYLGTKKKKKTTTEPKSQTRPVGKPTGPQERERKALPPLISRAQNSKAMKKIF